MIKINEQWNIPVHYLREEFFGNAGPGGQNVNKVATAVRIRLHLASAPLPEYMKSRLFLRLARHLNDSGELVCTCRVYRTQLLNRQEALQKMENLLREALKPVKTRRPTKPGAGVVRRRLKMKKEHSALKKQRQKNISDQS